MKHLLIFIVASIVINDANIVTLTMLPRAFELIRRCLNDVIFLEEHLNFKKAKWKSAYHSLSNGVQSTIVCSCLQNTTSTLVRSSSEITSEPLVPKISTTYILFYYCYYCCSLFIIYIINIHVENTVSRPHGRIYLALLAPYTLDLIPMRGGPYSDHV